jgi:hypothetical protein
MTWPGTADRYGWSELSGGDVGQVDPGHHITGDAGDLAAQAVGDLQRAIVLSLAGAGDASASGNPATWVSWLKVALGLLLLLVALRQFRGRPRGDDEAAMPKWMAGIAGTRPVAALGLAAVLSGANPKNLLLASSGAAAIAQTGSPGGRQAVAYLVFALVGTLGVAVPVVIYFALGDRSEKLLAGLKDWMSRYNAVIMSVLCLVIAAKLIGDGISGLAA